MKNFFQNNQLLVYSTTALAVLACVVVGIFALVEQDNTKKFYYEDGALKEKHYYHSDESLEKIEFYSVEEVLVQIMYYRENGNALDRIEVFDENGNLQLKNYYRADNTSERLEEYRQDGTLSTVTYINTNGTNTIEYYDENGKLMPTQ